MKTGFLFLVALLFHMGAMAQARSGKVIYKVRPPSSIAHSVMDTTNIKQSAIRSIFAQRFYKSQMAMPYISFTMTFNPGEAVFSENTAMTNDNGIDINAVLGLGNFTRGIFYTKTANDILIHQYDHPGRGGLIRVVYNLKGNNGWKITEGTKVILGYRCLKATKTINLNAKVKGKATAWFCPELPYQFGPGNLAGLPGLILAVDRNGYYFYADKISFRKRKYPIEKPTKGKSITRTELLGIYSEDNKK